MGKEKEMTESFGKILRAAPGWGEEAAWKAFRQPTLKGDRPAPKEHKLTERQIKAMRERYGIRK